METAKRDTSRPRLRGDELEEKAPVSSKVRTAEIRNPPTSKKRQPETTQKPLSSRRQRDLSDSVAQTQKQVEEILETITTAEADAVVVVSRSSRNSVLLANLDFSPVEKFLVTTAPRDPIRSTHYSRVHPRTEW
ncbi:hypothetical protein PHMEG_0004174 [Phytophthora megakarya]|uniref:Uncharacterized protein n=1 Tax=Phytophthora megakarya TaxID=4795 RepID=A0A225WW27_9STRA|nr:hypothetical protein PHMEG_0004174 [Phytophthora megakarya]